MEFDTSDYFAYKKSKMQTELKKQNKTISKFNFLIQLFFATFVVIFIIVVVAIMKYSAKMDIEYTKGDFSYSNSEPSSISGYNTVDYDDEQRKIDKRLMLIQQEENAPSEAKIIQSDKQKKEQVISPEHIENSKKIDKMEKIKAKNKESETSANRLNDVIDEVKHFAGKAPIPKKTSFDENVTISSKVLVGRFSSFDEAAKLQSDIKAKESSLSPFVRKVGDVYSVQMGSYQDFHTAKTQAQKLKSYGFDVWIYQQ